MLSSPSFAGETVTYTYDALGRLIDSSTSGTVNNGQSTAITYDPAGNRTNYTMSTGGGGGPGAQLSISNASVTEGGVLSFTVTRSGTTTTAVSASYATSNGTAVAGSDYTAKSGTVSFAAGQTSKPVTVMTIDDSLVESAETLTVTLSNPSAGATVTTAAGTGTINDNDSPSGFSATLTAGSYQLCVFGCTMYYGYSSVWPIMGSMSSTAWGSHTITSIYNGNGFVFFAVAGAAPNSGWTSITIPGVGTLTRASASYSSGTNATNWSWATTSNVTSGTVNIQ